MNRDEAAQAERQPALPSETLDDGKSGGAVNRGMPGRGNFRGQDAAGTNTMAGRAAGSENERTAPGISTDKKADDTK